jgi:hypothetical protein
LPARWRLFTTCLPARQKKRINRDKASLDIFWVREESLEDSDNLPDPVLAQEIVVPRLTSLGTTPSQGYGQAVDRVEGSKTSKLPWN